jgi:predicted signal transduction protein with EAL and GGDEF domain
MKLAEIYWKAHALFSVTSDSALLQAQHRAFTRQMPILYFILLTNTWVVGFSYKAMAPLWLSVFCPTLLTALCGCRLVVWWRASGKELTDEKVARALTRTNRLAWALTIAFSLWAFALFPYGDPYTRSLVALYIAINVTGSIICLMHLRPAALGVALIGSAVFVAFFGSTGNSTLVAMAINFALVSGALVTMLVIFYRDFTEVISAHVSTQALSNEKLRLANLDSLTGLPNRRHFFLF